MKTNNIRLELGHAKYINKNPVGERAIRELHGEINRVNGTASSVTPVTLALAVTNLNSRIRSGGLSALEVFTQRDQFTGDQIPLQDREIIKRKELERKSSHMSSAKYRSRGKTVPLYPTLKPGDLIYINSDRLKTRARDRYIVVSVGSSTCKVQKFVGRARSYILSTGMMY